MNKHFTIRGSIRGIALSLMLPSLLIAALLMSGQTSHQASSITGESALLQAGVAPPILDVRAQLERCDAERVAELESEFGLINDQYAAGLVEHEQLRAVALALIAESDKCYAEMMTSNDGKIDDGGLWGPGDNPYEHEGLDSPNYVLFGTKWGGGGFGTSGGTVTFSFIPNGVNMSAHAGHINGITSTSNIAITSLPTYQACFMERIRNAFAVWSAVANIRFQEVADNGLPAGANGATGQIRIGSVPISPMGVLAWAFFPGGSSIAGDMTFDSADNWACTPGSGRFDIGIVAMHEIGHSIGLNHEPSSGNLAVMNPTYNASLGKLQQDDINGGVAIYGVAPATRDTLAFFNPTNGQANLVSVFGDDPPPSAYNAYTTGAPINGQWVMGDWNGNGVKTPGVFSGGAFYRTNSIGATGDWSPHWIGPNGTAIAGRFNPALSRDCFGVIQQGTLSGLTVFALWYTCDFSTVTPSVTWHWVSAPLPDNAGFSGAFQFVVGDWDGNGSDTIAVRRGEYIAYTQVAIVQGAQVNTNAEFTFAQLLGTPHTGAGIGQFVAGDWNGNGSDSFGLVYDNDRFYYRHSTDWNPSEGFYYHRLTSGIPSPRHIASWRAGAAPLTATDAESWESIPLEAAPLMPLDSIESDGLQPLD